MELFGRTSAGAAFQGQAGIADNFSAIPEHLSRPAMQQDQEWIGGVLSPDHHPLVDPAPMQIADLGDASKQDLTASFSERRRISYVSCSNNRMITNLLGRRNRRRA